MDTVPFKVLCPVAKAVPEEAESVMNELASWVVVIPWAPNEVNERDLGASGYFPPLMEPANISALETCGSPIPSPTKRKTYFAGFPLYELLTAPLAERELLTLYAAPAIIKKKNTIKAGLTAECFNLNMKSSIILNSEQLKLYRLFFYNVSVNFP